METNNDYHEESSHHVDMRSVAPSEEVKLKDKVFEFVYSDCIYESGYMTISIHKTKEGAEKALESHKAKVKAEWEEMYPDNEMGAFDAMKGWGVNETEVLE